MLNQLTEKLNLRESLLLGVTVSSLIFAFLSRYPRTQNSDLAGGEGPVPKRSLAGNPVSTGSQPAEVPESTEISAGEKLKSGMTLERARERFEQASAITDIQQQALIYRETIRELCRAGYIQEAWDMMLQEPGYSRDSQICAFFLTAPLDLKDCSEKIALLQSSGEKKTALEYYLAKNFDQYPGILEKPDFKRIMENLRESDPDALAGILSTAVRTRFDSSDESEKEKLNQIVRNLHSEKRLSNDDFANMVARNLGKPVSELWGWIEGSSMGMDKPEGYAGQMRGGILAGMVTENPPEALTRIAASTGEAASYDLRLGLTTWAKSSPQAANEWYEAQRARLTQPQQDAAAEAFAALALEYRELDGAETWANQISNQEIRKSVLEKIHPKPPQTP